VQPNKRTPHSARISSGRFQHLGRDRALRNEAGHKIWSGIVRAPGLPNHGTAITRLIMKEPMSIPRVGFQTSNDLCCCPVATHCCLERTAVRGSWAHPCRRTDGTVCLESFHVSLFDRVQAIDWWLSYSYINDTGPQSGGRVQTLSNPTRTNSSLKSYSVFGFSGVPPQPLNQLDFLLAISGLCKSSGAPLASSLWICSKEPMSLFDARRNPDPLD
jgi:hypothetical protein